MILATGVNPIPEAYGHGQIVPITLAFLNQNENQIRGNCRPFCGSVMENEAQICTAQDWSIRPRGELPPLKSRLPPRRIRACRKCPEIVRGKRDMNSNSTSPAASGWTGLWIGRPFFPVFDNRTVSRGQRALPKRG